MALVGLSKIFNLTKLIPCVKLAANQNLLSPFPMSPAIQRRDFRKAYGLFLRVMKGRRKLAGPDRVRRRSEWDNWNYATELYAFNKRLHENITEETLRLAFIHESYLKKEEEKRKELDLPLQDVQLDLQSNAGFITSGGDLISDYVKRYLQHGFQMLPVEGITAVHDYLLSDEVLSHVSFNIGTSDLMFCEEYPPSKATLAATLKALVGAIASDEGVPRAETFILDFVCPQLIGKDIFEIWDLEKPVEVLNSILVKHGLAQTESRLVFESGRNTIEAIYHVGIYSDKKFLGRGPGETVAIAEEMAAYDALRKLFHINNYEKPLPYGQKGRTLDLKNQRDNQCLASWSTNSLKQDLTAQ